MNEEQKTDKQQENAAARGSSVLACCTDDQSAPRVVSWFSCGAASAVATKLVQPDVIACCDAGSEDSDNLRFMTDCEKWFGQEVQVLKNEKYADTWEVWENRKYISGIKGAPCTGLLKVAPRIEFQRPNDLHVFGYTADKRDRKRAENLRLEYPELNISTPLIDKGITKAACLAMIQRAGIKPPRVYEMGFPNANCVPCCKATSPDYWAMVRHHFPMEFYRMAYLCRKFGARLTRIKDVRVFIDEIPPDWPMTNPIAPECDMLCWLADNEIRGAA